MSRFARLVPLVVLTLLPFAFLHRGFTGDADVLLGVRNGDLPTLLYPERAFAVASLESGDFPLWNPHIFCGLPFHAGAIHALLYPPNALSLVLPLSTTFNLLFAMHAAIAGLLTFALLRELGARPAAALFGAIAFAAAARPILLAAAGQAPQAAALAWTPGLFWLAERIARRPSTGAVLALAVLSALAVLAGYPQYLVYASLAVVVLAAGRYGAAVARRETDAARARGRALLLTCAGLAWGALLAAAQLLPGLDYARHSFRAAGALAFLSTGNLSLAHFATLLFPAALGDTVRAPYFGPWSFWHTCQYAGIGTIAFAALALIGSRETRRRALPWAIVAAASFLLALGDNTPLYSLFVQLPIVGMFRGISKVMSVGMLALAVLAGLGLEAFLAARAHVERPRTQKPAQSGSERSEDLARGGAARPRLTRRIAIVLAALALLGMAALAATAGDAGNARAERLYAALASPNEHGALAPTPQIIAAIRGALAVDALRLAGFAIVFLALVTASVRARNPLRGLFGPLAVILLAADLFLVFERVIPVQSVARDVHLAPEIAAAIRDTPPLARFGASERREARGILYAAAAVGGFEGNLPARTHTFMNFAAGRPLDAPQPTFQPSRLSPLLDLLVMQRLVLDGAAAIDTSAFHLVARSPRFGVYDRTHELPRAYLAHAVVSAPDRAALWTAIRDGKHNPYVIAAILGEDAGADSQPFRVDPLPAGALEDRPEVILDGPDRVVVHARPRVRALLVLLDAYDPGWRAAVDGRAANIVPVFGFFRGVFLEAGASEVIFTYAPRSFTAGVMLSLAGGAGALAIVIAGLARRRRGSRPHQST